MILKLAADAVVLVHFAFVSFVVLGGLAVWRWPRFIWLHLPAAAWGAVIEFTGRVCPLTPLENSLRLAAGETGYSGGFIEEYLIYAAIFEHNSQAVGDGPSLKQPSHWNEIFCSIECNKGKISIWMPVNTLHKIDGRDLNTGLNHRAGRINDRYFG